MQRFELDPAIRSQPALAEAIERTRPLFDDVLGASAPRAAAHWTLASSDGRPLIVLALSEDSRPEEVDASFTPEDLREPRGFRRRVHALWGDLLQAHLKGIVRTLNAMELGEVAS